MTTIATTLALLLLKLGPVTVNVDAKDGDLISGERVFRVTVQANNPVTQVEFYVGDDLRDTDTSTPYEFKLNALDEKDGDLKISFAAYTSESESGKKTITVKVDNGLDKGVDFHVNRGQDLLANGRYDDAIAAGRVALKIKPGHNGARMLLARAFFAKGTYDQAQKFAEDVVAAEPNNGDARELLAGINLQRAFTTFNRGGDKAETLATIAGALKTSAENRRLNLDAKFDAMGAPTDANRLAYADAALRAHRYSSAINALAGAFTKDPKNNAVVNRLVYAYIRSGRNEDARSALNTVKRVGALDGYGNALAGILEVNSGNDAAADDAIKEAILSDNEDMGVRTAQVYVALKRGKTNAMRDLLVGLSADAGRRPEVNFYLTILLSAQQQFSEAQKSFELAALAEPSFYELFVERANQALALASSGRVTDKDAVTYQYAVAAAFLEAALAAKPDAPEVLTGLSIANLLQGKIGEAAKYGKAAVQAGPNYAAGHYTYSCVCSVLVDDLAARAEKIRREDKDGVLDSDQKAEIARMENEARTYRVETQRSRDAAEKLDRSNLSGRPIPVVNDAFVYFYRHGRAPVLTLPR